MGYTGQICTEPGMVAMYISLLYVSVYNCFIVYIDCDVNPCENNGTCRLLAGSYICNCSSGFSGLFCEQSNCNYNLWLFFK